MPTRTGASGKSSRVSDRQAMRAVPARCAALAATAFLLSCATVKEPSPASAARRPPQAVISWQIAPADGYQDEGTFVRLDYLPCVQGQDTAGADDPPFPPGGRLTVHLGYRDLRDANTAWYSFEVTEAGRTVLKVDGAFDVPNIKGPDGYWWNDVQLDLPVEPTCETLVAVSDRRSGAVREFLLWRVETLVPAAGPAS